MKNSIIASLFFLIIFSGFSQNLNYEVRGKYIHPVLKDDLSNVKSMSDIIPYYPASWISSYVSVEISAISDDITLTASGTNEILTDEQLSLINSAALGTEIVINIQYISENTISAISEKIERAVVRFTVNEPGEIADAQISKTSGDPGIDELLLGVINNMPAWKPAEDANGAKVEQEFVFTVGNDGC
jgi:TonB family protein